MKKETKKNKILFVQADERAEELIKSYINNVGKINNKKYTVTFEYTNDEQVRIIIFLPVLFHEEK